MSIYKAAALYDIESNLDKLNIDSPRDHGYILQTPNTKENALNVKRDITNTKENALNRKENAPNHKENCPNTKENDLPCLQTNDKQHKDNSPENRPVSQNTSRKKRKRIIQNDLTPECDHRIDRPLNSKHDHVVKFTKFHCASFQRFPIAINCLVDNYIDTQEPHSHLFTDGKYNAPLDITDMHYYTYPWATDRHLKTLGLYYDALTQYVRNTILDRVQFVKQQHVSYHHPDDSLVLKQLQCGFQNDNVCKPSSTVVAPDDIVIAVAFGTYYMRLALVDYDAMHKNVGKAFDLKDNTVLSDYINYVIMAYPK